MTKVENFMISNGITSQDIVNASKIVEKKMNEYELSYPTICKVKNGKEVTTKTATKFIRAVNYILNKRGYNSVGILQVGINLKKSWYLE